MTIKFSNWKLGEKYQHMEKNEIAFGTNKVHGLKWMDVWILMD
jgi:hypothetical protein